MEYFDLLDAEGKPTGQKKLRNLVHRDGDWHRSVHVWIMNSKGELLLQKRSPNKESHHDHWDISSAGHVTAGDDSMSTAVKEIKEELGLEVKPQDITFLFSYKVQSVLNNGTFINNEFDDVYLVKADVDISTMHYQQEEVSGLKWISISDLKEVHKNKTPGYVPHSKEYDLLFEHLAKE